MSKFIAPDLTQKYKPYWIAVYSNGDVRKLSFSGAPIPDSDIRLLIHCEFSSAGKNTVYYRNKLYDNTGKRIEDNTINWEGVKCRVEEEERWAKTNGWHYESIVADIWDKFDVKETKVFPNFDHDGSGFIGLFGYIEDLMLISSHKGVEIIREIIQQKDEEIIRLTNQLNEL
jgi:hypothetical protein